ncbi:hypothetical protein ARAM_005068 [Aspergillus rambellii]|uniref:Zn(2)-C6 fungal-type domain-containing protein n=2 Tax=Aspergillus subgen. Nidulantes TaxID=2720870 RepID=A0A0F8XEH1_9EURO|nr:hypothetical protein AOCH_002604 [Aspergillus ochraceoroseus]KKK21982.1 hypothetical protein ARAM_005068 [Aspergillus rambellii]
MVYHGKPSTGCQSCRSRHIKCDETRPHCKACVRTGRQCPGYPHPLDFMLRDRIAFTRRGRSTSSQTPSFVKSDDAAGPSEVSTIPSVTRAVQPGTPPVSAASSHIPSTLCLPMEDTVTSLFFNSYLYLPKDPLVRTGFMELLPQLFATAPLDSHLRLGTLAVAFFSVAAWTHQESLLRSSQQCFVKALSRTRQALQGNIDQNLDEILMTVLLLSTYEEFCAMKENKPPSKAHLRGAIALINSYSPERRNSPQSKKLTNAVQTQIINTSISGAFPLIQTPDAWPLPLSVPEFASSQLTMATTEVVKLRQRWMRVSDASYMAEVELILSQARYIDSQLVAWSHSLPEHWIPAAASTIPPSVQKAGIYQGRCDCYSDFWIPATWNSYRNSRLVVQEIILQCLSVLPGRAEAINATIATIRAIALDVCATVPFYLGSQMASVQMNPSLVEYPKAETRRVSQAHQQTAPLLGGWFVFSSLETLCAVESLTEDHREWIRGQLQRVLQIYIFGPARL